MFFWENWPSILPMTPWMNGTMSFSLNDSFSPPLSILRRSSSWFISSSIFSTLRYIIL